MIHPGEFGTYREKNCKDLIRMMTPAKLDIGTGFVITAKNRISHQCDLIVYDKSNTPILETEEKQRFFPIESVVAIGEVKSDVDKSNLKKALLRLKDIKEMRFDVNESAAFTFKRNVLQTKFNPNENIYDQVFTFLICNKFDFNSDNLVNEIDSMYDNNDAKLKHNMILSVLDGTLMYLSEEDRPIHYPVLNNKELDNVAIKNVTHQMSFVDTNVRCNKYEHIVAFLNYYFNGVSLVSTIDIDMTEYLGITRAKRLIKQTPNNVIS